MHLRFPLYKQQHLLKTKFVSAITDWLKASVAYYRMQKKASGSGFGQNARHTVNFALSQSLKQIKEYFSQSPISVGLIKVPLFTKLSILFTSKKWQIGALENYIHFEITFYGNSRNKYLLSDSIAFPCKDVFSIIITPVSLSI